MPIIYLPFIKIDEICWNDKIHVNVALNSCLEDFFFGKTASQ